MNSIFNRSVSLGEITEITNQFLGYENQSFIFKEILCASIRYFFSPFWGLNTCNGSDLILIFYRLLGVLVI
jgi:hypothetical protein